MLTMVLAVEGQVSHVVWSQAPFSQVKFLALILQWKLWRSQTICSLYQAFLLATESGLSLNPILQQSMPTYRLRSQPPPEPEEHFDIPMPAFLGKVFD